MSGRQSKGYVSEEKEPLTQFRRIYISNRKDRLIFVHILQDTPLVNFRKSKQTHITSTIG